MKPYQGGSTPHYIIQNSGSYSPLSLLICTLAISNEEKSQIYLMGWE